LSLQAQPVRLFRPRFGGAFSLQDGFGTKKPLRIGIVGYGTGGQAAALLLARDGHRVEVFEQAPQLGPVGAGFLLQPTGLAVLWQLGLLDETLRHGARVGRLFGETREGRAVMDMRYRDLDRRLFGLGMQRGALFALLDTAWQEARNVHCGRRIVGIDAEAGVLHDEHGRGAWRVRSVGHRGWCGLAIA
jgi:FAD-dependent urate hydroxylase